MKIQTILDSIDQGAIALPEFQRGYVWNRNQVKDLVDSLYRQHPVGSLLVWQTKTESAHARGDGKLSAGVVKLLLDGQQRITSLYGLVNGKAPRFFDGNDSAFTGLYFNLDSETFEFYAPLKMKDNPKWISVTELMKSGVGSFTLELNEAGTPRDLLTVYINRLNAIENIKNIDLHIEEVTGEDKTVDVVVGIFNRVNSGGTKLSKGDLALAKICAEWPDARVELKTRLEKWNRAGFHLKLDWLLRCITSVTTGEAYFESLADVTIEEFRSGLSKAEKAVDHLLNLIGSRLGLDHDRVLGSRYSFPLVARYLVNRNFKPLDHSQRDRLLFWYIHTFLWGRYAGSTESTLSQDLNVLKTEEEPLERLLELLRRDRGNLSVSANDFIGWSRGARFYPLLYMLSRVWGARDWGSGVELKNSLLGNLSNLQLHHIFPKSRLYEEGFDRPLVNALANFTFLTQETNLDITNRLPSDYLPEVERRHPGALKSHWIPDDPDLWKKENYELFLEARRELLSEAANEFLTILAAGRVPDTAVINIADRKVAIPPGSIEDEEEERKLIELNAWVVECGLHEGELEYELVDPASGRSLAILDLAWPEGLQPGFSQPVAVLLNEGPETRDAASQADIRYFTDAASFRDYVSEEVLKLQAESST